MRSSPDSSSLACRINLPSKFTMIIDAILMKDAPIHPNMEATKRVDTCPASSPQSLGDASASLSVPTVVVDRAQGISSGDETN